MIIRNRDITSKHLCHFCISDQDHDLMTNPMTDSMTSPRLNSWPIRWYANPWVNDQTHKWLHGWPQEWSHDWPHILITDMADKNCDVWAVSHSSNVFLWFNHNIINIFIVLFSEKTYCCSRVTLPRGWTLSWGRRCGSLGGKSRSRTWATSRRSWWFLRHLQRLLCKWSCVSWMCCCIAMHWCCSIKINPEWTLWQLGVIVWVGEYQKASRWIQIITDLANYWWSYALLFYADKR